MFKKDEKYTMEEFKKMYDKAVVETLAELENDMNKTQEQSGKKSEMGSLIFKMQNIMVSGMIKAKLFEEEK